MLLRDLQDLLFEGKHKQDLVIDTGIDIHVTNPNLDSKIISFFKL